MTDETGMILMPRGNVMALFDIITASMDFGSGFLDDEEVEMLRSVAAMLGVDPADATPYNHQRRYPHRFRPLPGAQPDWCSRCGLLRDQAPHAPEV